MNDSTSLLRRVFRRRALPFILLLLAAHAGAAGFDIAQLMQTLAQTRGAQATFVEKKYIAILDRPIESSGELVYQAPGHLEKRTLRPKAEDMILDGHELTFIRGKQRRSMQLQDYPQIAAFTDSIRGTMAGDRKALERLFRLELEGGPERWQLSLTPTDSGSGASAYVQRIRIGGSRDNVTSIEIVQKDGDRSVMTITRSPAP
ncbi:outer membrane lipoprotein carrier protein LolA [Paludibacterium yongneupense]|uniref:outer membrane lipoprotein carrier protein LolA n=1 Tax=Paludibacterium yongneupense TaxID=400061 RepID=UPI00040F35E6|nr:outer membrane lipoprotein carrier protein LolA [Paludibacterium yongneupense]